MLHDLWKNGKAHETGICLIPVTRITSEENNYCNSLYWRNIVFGCTDLNGKQLAHYSQQSGKTLTLANFVVLN